MATRRVLGLLESGARVTVVAPVLSAELKKMAEKKLVVLVERAFREVDLGGVLLVFASTSDNRVNKEVAHHCRRRKILCNVVDTPDLCDFVVPSRITRGDFMVTVSTDGRVPFLARQVRLELEKIFGPEMEVLLEILAKKRKHFLEEGKTVFMEKLSRLDLTPLREILRHGFKGDKIASQAERWIDEKMGLIER